MVLYYIAGTILQYSAAAFKKLNTPPPHTHTPEGDHLRHRVRKIVVGQENLSLLPKRFLSKHVYLSKVQIYITYVPIIHLFL